MNVENFGLLSMRNYQIYQQKIGPNVYLYREERHASVELMTSLCQGVERNA
jgi:hypothetical protein